MKIRRAIFAQAINQGKVSISEAARMSGCCRRTVKEWMQNYEVGGINVFLAHEDVAFSEAKTVSIKDWYFSPKIPLTNHISACQRIADSRKYHDLFMDTSLVSCLSEKIRSSGY